MVLLRAIVVVPGRGTIPCEIVAFSAKRSESVQLPEAARGLSHPVFALAKRSQVELKSQQSCGFVIDL
jgi:hypothetical protein